MFLVSNSASQFSLTIFMRPKLARPRPLHIFLPAQHDTLSHFLQPQLHISAILQFDVFIDIVT